MLLSASPPWLLLGARSTRSEPGVRRPRALHEHVTRHCERDELQDDLVKARVRARARARARVGVGGGDGRVGVRVRRVRVRVRVTTEEMIHTYRITG